MYLQHFGLTEPPFAITPDPRFVFLSERHRDALAHLSYGISQGGGGGFVQLTGEVGTGKTTLCRLLLEQLPENTRVALVLNPRVSPEELLETVCEELGIDTTGRRGRIKPLVDALNTYLLDAYAQGLRIVLIIDEAQNLSFEALEQVRLLTNLETSTQKLLQIILIGQPELRGMLARENLRQLAQRITARFHLTPLSAPETGAYLRHRFAIAGGTHMPFSPDAVQRIHARTGGIPRLINVVAERALLAGYVHERTTIDAPLVERAADEALDTTRRASSSASRRWFSPPRLAAVAAVAVVATGVGVWIGSAVEGSAPTAQARTTEVQPAGQPVAPGPISAAAAPPTSPTPPAAGTLAAALARTNGDESAAWAELVRLWQLPGGEVAQARVRACDPVPVPGLHCARGVTTLEAIAAIDRPAVLRLQAPRGPASVLLLGLDGDRVRLWLDGGPVAVPRGELAPVWSGNYTMLWSAPQLASLPLPAQGDGPAVDWLRARLGHAGPPVFDTAMRSALKDYQRRHGLVPDGVPGPATRSMLATADAGPQLQRTE
ncbi:AAA family ATPase [Lysobacter korlensis]|uniref:AAA family ATPase n=1 Tax=Lysobacter korlensis TaxID=553636 RepID=A0ABV6RK43_9GAMM